MSLPFKDQSKIVLCLALLSTVGCTGINRLGDKMDIASTHIDAPGQPLYEGQLEMAKRIGDMTSLQFADGKFFDVADAPSALIHGDMVRIYQTDKGYEARLWKANDDPTLANSGLGSMSNVHSRS